MIWDYKKANVDGIRKSLNSVDWEFNLSGKNVHQQAQYLNEYQAQYQAQYLVLTNFDVMNELTSELSSIISQRKMNIILDLLKS